MNYASIKIGDSEQFEKIINKEDVYVFAGLTGDFNPVHLSNGGAKYDGKTMAHGLLTGSLFSRMFGMIFPGEGAIYISQSFKFVAPVFINDKVFIKVTAKEKLGKGKILFECLALNQNGQIVITGEAVLLIGE